MIQSTKQELPDTPTEAVVIVHPEWRKHLMPEMVWGVFSRDMYGIRQPEQSKYLLKTFDDYGQALSYAERLGENSSIHLTHERKDHVGGE